jgi:hypothetical protein
MGPGHLGIGLAAKRAAPNLPLWALLAASEALDLLSFVFKSVGLEDFGVSKTTLERGVEMIIPGSVPWSHGLFMSVIWSLLAAGIIYLFYRDQRASVIFGLVVMSHWLLDFIVHPPDLPLLFENSPRIGLGLWSTGSGLLISIVIEITLIGGGLVLYFRCK